MRPRLRFIIVLLVVIFAAAWCGTRVHAQDHRGGRGSQMRGQQHSGRQPHPGYYGRRDGQHAQPRQNMDHGRSYGQRRPPDSYGGRHQYRPAPRYRGYGHGYGYRYHPYGYRYRPYYGYGYYYGYRRECSAEVFDVYGHVYWVPGYWSYGMFESVCIPY